jgi:hypothetical protein
VDHISKYLQNRKSENRGKTGYIRKRASKFVARSRTEIFTKIGKARNRIKKRKKKG